MSCGVGHRHSLDLAVLWCRPAAAALLQPLACELPSIVVVVLKRKKKLSEIKTKTAAQVAAVARIRSLAREIPYPTEAAKKEIKIKIN